MSLQYHQHRAEHWVVVRGSGRGDLRRPGLPARGERVHLRPPRAPRTALANPGHGAGGDHRGAVGGLPGRGRHRPPGGQLRDGVGGQAALARRDRRRPPSPAAACGARGMGLLPSSTRAGFTSVSQLPIRRRDAFAELGEQRLQAPRVLRLRMGVRGQQAEPAPGEQLVKRLLALLAEHAAEASGRPLQHRSRVQTRRQGIGRALHPLVPLRMSEDRQETRRRSAGRWSPRGRAASPEYGISMITARPESSPASELPHRPLRRCRACGWCRGRTVAATVRSTSKPSSRRTGMACSLTRRDDLAVRFPRALHEVVGPARRGAECRRWCWSPEPRPPGSCAASSPDPGSHGPPREARASGYR